MAKIKKQWDFLKKEEKDFCIQEIIRFFEEEKEESIGIIMAESFLDFFLDNITRNIYNKKVRDSKELLEKRFEDVKMDVDLLQNI